MAKKKTKKKEKPVILYIAIAMAAMLAILIASTFFGGNGKVNRNGGLSETKADKSFDERMTLLKKEAFSSEGIKNIYAPEEAFDENNAYTVFISLCDAKSRAVVLHESAPTLEKAWDKAESTARDYVDDNNYNALWLKADIVDSMSKISVAKFNSDLNGYFNEFYRKGISFDESFETALLEAEINGNKIIDYKQTKTINRSTLNEYLLANKRSTVQSIPEEIVAFTCLGFMCDEESKVYALYGFGNNDGLDYGRRICEVDRGVLKDVVLSASEWLSNEIQSDGKFVYGYYPTYDRAFTSYNILRHTTGILPLVWNYKITGDKEMKKAADKTLDYLLDQIVEKSDGVSYVLDKTNSEIKLGGSGLAIIAADTYMDVFGKDDDIIETLTELGRGMLELQNSDGSYYHVLNTDFSKKEKFRTVYYDGEATYGFCVLYKLTNDAKWLDAAKKSVEYFIANDYTKHRDHWVAYAVNEITKYIPDARYYEFGLKNLKVNMDRIYNQKTTYHTYMELLMAGFEMYDRMIEENIECDYLNEFDGSYFARTIQRRAEHMLNGFLYPEYAMYLKNPEAIVGTFCVRHDGYRIRVDDVDHFVAGYNHYYELYDKVQKYLK